jgi:predicted signal transduction protein with EAL and GGDEF domain
MRIGGDEFAVLLAGEACADRAPEKLAEVLVKALHEPIGLSCTTAVVGASIGIADFDSNCAEHSDLLRRSDMAMYEAKRLGRNRWARFDERLESELRRRNSSEREIRQGIAENGFVPFFQPIVDLAERKVTGFEVLARWQRADGNILEPDEFISGAEAAGVIAELSFSVMRKALEIARDWPHEYRLAVNISPVQFKDPYLAQRILLILSQAGFPAQRLELEITESSLIGDHEQAMATITSLRNCGAGIVAEQVVDFLEAVQIDQQQRDRPRRRGDQARHALAEEAPVVEAGDVVDIGPFHRLALGPVALGERETQLFRPAPGEQQQGDVEQESGDEARFLDQRTG